MFDPCQKSTGTRHTMTAALLLVAFVFSPAVLIVSRPVGYVSVSLALVCSSLCVALAWVNWRKYSDLTILSIGSQSRKAK